MKTEKSGLALDRCNREIHEFLRYGLGNQKFGGSIHKNQEGGLGSEQEVDKFNWDLLVTEAPCT